jgi:hypothetical protein
MISMNISSVAFSVANKMLELGGGNVSRHLGEIVNGDTLASFSDCWCLPFLSSVQKIIRGFGDRRSIILTIGLPESSKLQPNQRIDLALAPLSPTEAAIYLFNGHDFFIDAFEDYRRAIILPAEFSNISCIYRSWRSLVAEENGWNFSNDIYLWSSGEDDRAHIPIN